MKNPKYYPECEECSRYHVERPDERAKIDKLRQIIYERVEKAKKDRLPTEKYLTNHYKSCNRCIEKRVEDFDNKFIFRIKVKL